MENKLEIEEMDLTMGSDKAQPGGSIDQGEPPQSAAETECSNQLTLSRSTVFYEEEAAGVFSFDSLRPTKGWPIKMSVWSMQGLIRALPVAETLMSKAEDDEDRPDGTIFSRFVHDSQRGRVKLEVSMFNGTPYMFLRSYYRPPGGETRPPSAMGPEAGTDDRVRAFEQALNQRRALEEDWRPAKSVQLCLEDIDSLMDFVRYHVRPKNLPK